MKVKYLVGFVGGAIMAATMASAAVLDFNGSGQLTGATGVDVDGTLYDVAFVDGTCANLFNGCDNPMDDFVFLTQALADSASQALLNQVLFDGAMGNFRSQPELVFGIDPFNPAAPNNTGSVITAYEINGGAVRGSTAIISNNPTTAGQVGSAVLGITNRDTSATTRAGRSTVFADWSVSNVVIVDPPMPAVPLPAGFVLSLTAFGGLFGLRRMKRKS